MFTITVRQECDALKNFSAAVLTQAIEDWRALISNKAHHTKYNELRRFFKSDWADLLCHEVLNREATFILDVLEQERRDSYVHR